MRRNRHETIYLLSPNSISLEVNHTLETERKEEGPERQEKGAVIPSPFLHKPYDAISGKCGFYPHYKGIWVFPV